MGSYTFKWECPTDNVSDILVTGSFDGWTKSVKLEKEGTCFQKTVIFPSKAASSKIYYKFVVDNNWTINESYPHEADHEGNVNNFLTPHDLSDSKSAPVSALAAAPFINTVTPESTTVTEMAKKNNNKKKAANKQPAAAGSTEPKPETNVAEATAPAAAASAVAAEATATPSDLPGGFPVTPSNEAADLENETVSVNPLPGTAPGTSNPIKLAPGEKIPESITTQNINQYVKLDKESYEKSDTLPTAPALSTDIPPISGTMIPESSLPMGVQTDVTNSNISSVGPNSTTAALAGQVPLEPKVPKVVKESQKKAGAAPEASGVPKEVKDKAQVEKEIKDKIPEAPATSIGTSGMSTEKQENTDTIIGATVATGTAAIAAAVAAVTKFSDDATPALNETKKSTMETINKNLPDTVKANLPEPVQSALAIDKKDSPLEKVSPEVPKEVKASIAEAGKNPEAAASTSAVKEKKEVESQLLKEVEKTPAVGEPVETPVETPETKPTGATLTGVTAAKTSVSNAADNGANDAQSKASEPAPTPAPAPATAPVTTPATAPAAAAANGAEAESKSAADDGTTHDKKKGRLSVMMSKLKAKLKPS
ncbi:hypothetical protein NOR_08156 [Metarhizium rileyi]|uniref:AMP-activated protein kinase glycogen-binding domain-containing protein n=1 Tax=Metarhizium rileyi (strain RCEF 4871) TaxID=1649241 RepID=A0A166WSZ7_METRR|nr:hypothetical protein NOR_08156 [Metarhizium rileyi RCEF 4871]